MFICHPLPDNSAETPAPISFTTLRSLAEWLPALLSILTLPLAFPGRIRTAPVILPAFLSYQPPSPPPRPERITFNQSYFQVYNTF
jgi:hypothetical protein